MNAIFIVIVVVSIIMVCIISPESALTIMLDGSMNAISLSFKMLAIYAVWMSILKMMESTGLDKKIANLFTPITHKLFKGESDEAHSYISVNLASNMLGMGGAATPAGIKAIGEMYRGSKMATKNMIMLLVINATSIQILPATVMAMMSAHGSAAASSIIIPSLISTIVSTLSGIALVSLTKD
ncbi:MAG: hypothetical protein RR357_00045 [Clostridia bacterium]